MTLKAKEEYFKFLLRTEVEKDRLDFHLPENLSRKFIGYQGIHQDLSTCKECLHKLKENHDEVLETALYTSFVILYGKCFADSSSTKYPKLEKVIFKDTEKDYSELHNKIIDMRNNYIAHRGNSDYENAKVFFQIKPETMEWGIQVGQIKLINFEKSDIDEIINLTEFLLETVMAKYLKIGEKTLLHIFETYTPEQIAELQIKKNESE